MITKGQDSRLLRSATVRFQIQCFHDKGAHEVRVFHEENRLVYAATYPNGMIETLSTKVPEDIEWCLQKVSQFPSNYLPSHDELVRRKRERFIWNVKSHLRLAVQTLVENF